MSRMIACNDLKAELMLAIKRKEREEAGMQTEPECREETAEKYRIHTLTHVKGLN